MKSILSFFLLILIPSLVNSFSLPTVKIEPLSKQMEALNYISQNEDCLKGFLFLIGKRTSKKKLPSKYMVANKPAIKISKYIYTPATQEEGFLCERNTFTSIESSSIEENELLYSLSNTNKENRFLLYFSKSSGDSGYLEFKIVACKKSEDSFIPNTHFGKVMIVQFCFDKGNISLSKTKLITAG